jgi:hypothetical protein
MPIAWLSRRRFFSGLLLASALLVCFAGWLWMASGPRVPRERFEQVKEGMTREEVIRIVRRPPKNYVAVVDAESGVVRSLQYDRWICDGDDGVLLVLFDDADKAVDVLIKDFEPPTLIERILSWLGL